MIINFDALKERDAELYKLSSAYSGCRAGQHKLSENMFPKDIWERLITFNTPPVEEQRPDPSVRMREETQRAAAAARIEQLHEEGLIDCESNAKLIGNYFRDHKLSFSVATVNDVILHVLRADLAWAPKVKVAVVVPPPPQPVAAAPAPVVPAPVPTEVLKVLSDGCLQIPLGATPSKNHTTAQLKDWLARTNAGKLRRSSGSFSSKF